MNSQCDVYKLKYDICTTETDEVINGNFFTPYHLFSESMSLVCSVKCILVTTNENLLVADTILPHAISVVETTIYFVCKTKIEREESWLQIELMRHTVHGTTRIVSLLVASISCGHYYVLSLAAHTRE
jgi:hypothetical protein